KDRPQSPPASPMAPPLPRRTHAADEIQTKMKCSPSPSDLILPASSLAAVIGNPF
ncbi:hypothetical protein AVEN_59174-1, partial [Araneus ventricosus]